MDARTKNINIWDEIYSNVTKGMTYPNDLLVRISHRFFNKDKHKKILEYGFGGGADIMHFCRNGYEVSGVEISQSAIDSLNERLQALGYQADLKLLQDRKIPFPDNSFDVVIAWHVLMYNNWEDLAFAVNEINRVLKPGGMFLGTLCAVGDYSHVHSVPLGDCIYESTVPGQEGAIVMVLEEKDIPRCFPGQLIKVGTNGYKYDNFFANYWVVSYEKGASNED